MSDSDDYLDKIAKRWIEDAYTTKAADIPEVIYHYTDAAGLYGTLRTGKIWATDTHFLNDREEMTHLISAAKRHISTLASGNADKALRKLYRNIEHFQNMESLNSYFVFSLSSEKDDLSQWRGYARDGCGFTIGLSTAAILKQSNAGDFGFAKVEYEPDRQAKLLDLALCDIREAMVTLIAADPDNADDIAASAASNYDWCVEHMAAISKHKSFISENEWRIVASTTNSRPTFDILTRVRGYKVVPYTEIALKQPDGKLPLVSIGVGPGFQFSEQKQAVDFMCREFGYQPEIYAADSPYRQA